ncbi:hypothetical protein [Hymenobacter terricola]|uniref:hypothetical protein n=1 Tax=Hymenobacter terricola TaxID=2819236 RepID=UPI001B303B34|nr:hypothetical protein [Hymenobacter terricola]
MRKSKLIEDYAKLANDALAPFAHSAVRQTSTSGFIKNGGELTKPLDVAVALLDADVAATDHPMPAQTAQRDLLRAATVLELNRLAKRLNLDYLADEPALLSSGLTLASSTGTLARVAPATETVMDFDLVDSTIGCLLVKLKRPTGTTQNLIRYSLDGKLAEDNWLVAVGGGRERVLGPFESGTKIFVKAAGLTGSTTEPQYSAVKSRIVQ